MRDLVFSAGHSAWALQLVATRKSLFQIYPVLSLKGCDLRVGHHFLRISHIHTLLVIIGLNLLSTIRMTAVIFPSFPTYWFGHYTGFPLWNGFNINKSRWCGWVAPFLVPCVFPSPWWFQPMPRSSPWLIVALMAGGPWLFLGATGPNAGRHRGLITRLEKSSETMAFIQKIGVQTWWNDIDVRCYLISDVRCRCAWERYVLTFECLSCGHFLTTSDNLNRPHKFWCVFMFDPGRSQLPAWCRQLFSENLWTRRSKRSLSTWYGPPVIPDRDVKAYVDLVLSDPNSHLFSLIAFTAFFFQVA